MPFLIYGVSCMGFNSKLVRLKVMSINDQCVLEASKFQFQIGAIKSLSKVSSSAWLTKFQFQIGAIKSFATCFEMTAMNLLRFNSKLVRLKVWIS